MNLLIFIGGLLFMKIAFTTSDVIEWNDGFEGPFEPDVHAECPLGFTQPMHSHWKTCYKVYTSFKTSPQAAEQCRAVNGSLASVPNIYVNKYIYWLATEEGASSVWIGTECFDGNIETCQNDDKTQFQFSHFKPGQPNPDGICIFMSATGVDSQQWIAVECGAHSAYVCQVAIGKRDLPTTVTALSSTTAKPKIPTCPDNSWSLSVGSRDAYKALCFKVIYFSKVNYFGDVRKLCDDVGGTPAPMRNDEEKRAIQDNLKKNSLVYIGVGATLYIGLSDVSESRRVPADYRWEISGAPLGTWTWWSEGEPNRKLVDAYEYERCTGIYLRHDLKWNDISCSPLKTPATTGVVCAVEPN